MIRKDYLILPVKILVSLSLIALLYRNIPLGEMAARLSQTDLRFIFPIFILLFFNTFLSSWKWHLLLKADAIRIPLSELFASYLIGTFFNIFLPSNIGGDSYRIYDISKQSDLAGSAASVLADRLSGFLALVLLALGASIPVMQKIQTSAVIIIIPLAVLTILILVSGALYYRKPAEYCLRITRLSRIEAVSRFYGKFLDAFAHYRQSPLVMLKIMAISFGFQLSVILCVCLMAHSLQIRIALIYFIAFVPLITLMEALPISIYGVGVRDAGYVFFFGTVGLSALQTRSLALLYLIITVCYALIGGVLLAYKSFLFKNISSGH